MDDILLSTSCGNMDTVVAATTATTTTPSIATTAFDSSSIIEIKVPDSIQSEAYPEEDSNIIDAVAEAITDGNAEAVVDADVDEVDDGQPLSERWSPLGANYDDAHSPSSELLSPDCCEAELAASLERERQPTESATELARLRNIEEEQELLTSSLLALTSHFAHVQLRVRQIVEAPADERDQLLRDLEDFAFQGIPEAAQLKESAESEQPDDGKPVQPDSQLIEQLKTQLTELEQLAYEAGAPGVLPQQMLLEKQKFILDELKTKLNLQVEQHELPALSMEQLRHQVDNAIGEFVGPLKMKEQLVAQLKTQITDLERFIAFLQCDTGGTEGASSSADKLKQLSGAYNSYAAKQTARQMPSKSMSTKVATAAPSSEVSHVESAESEPRGESLHSKAHGLLDKASLLMQMFASTHFATRQADFQQNSLKKTHKGNHWGDLRAQLEVDIQEVAALAATLSCDREKLANIKRALRQHQASNATDSSGTITAQNGALTTVPPRCRRAGSGSGAGHELTPYATAQSSDESDEDAYERYDWDKSLGRRIVHMRGDSIATISRELTTVVRKNFARTLQQLIQHGLRIPAESATSSLMVPFLRCLNPGMIGAQRMAAHDELQETDGRFGSGDGGLRAQLFGSGRAMHAWELVLEYYYLKHGEEYNNTPARKLSQSFQLDIVDAQVVTAKQSLLTSVGMIVAMHRPYKRSYNAHFKAFVCAGLNAHLLVEWLNLILSCNELIDTYYATNSYVARTGFRDSLRSIDALSKFDFDLPIDLAVRHFRNI
ncbi:RUN domain-containing protein 1 [Scaptodrosophila lebanonensis]|uniref:RUN domain-containing protein 1 n=1 Tax=Drosophila lebanonensis TaxID=7225 RepID=A0A6J2TP36_DROLE|nr:RUN domain-containing protein 1 [Scaptodrosophila lebanonensis]